MARRLLDRPEIVSHDIVTRAMHRARTDDFDGTAWTEALEVLTRSLDREAELTMSARREVRDDMVSLLAHRPVWLDGSPRPTTTSGPRLPTVIVTAPDHHAVWEAEGALGAKMRGRTLLDETFVSTTFELRWQVPSYSEWLAEADLASAYADVARRSAVARPGATLDMLGAVEFGERLDVVDAAFPGAFLVEVERDLDDAIAATTEKSVLFRQQNARHVDAGKVERYWRWRLGLRDERRRDGRPADLTIAYDELVAAPDDVASRVFSAVGVSPPR